MKDRENGRRTRTEAPDPRRDGGQGSTAPPEGIGVTYLTRRQTVRVGSLPVLTVEVTLPRLQSDQPSGEDGTAAFNAWAEAAADAFTSYALGKPAGEAAASARAALAADPGAAYTLPRAVILCKLTMEPRAAGEGKAALYALVREVSFCARRGEKPSVTHREEAYFIYPPLRLAGGRGNRRISVRRAADP